jgi:hypothetical protein
MSIAFKCRCGQTLSAAETNAGRDMVCPYCSEIVTIPVPVPPLVPGVIRIEKSEVDQAPAPAATARGAERKAAETYELEDGTAKTTTMKASRRLAGKICPICQDEIRFGEDITICEHCKLPFHSACWQENGGCGTYGCSGASTVKQTRTFADILVPPEDIRQRRTPEARPVPVPGEIPAEREFSGLAIRNVSVMAVAALLASLAGMWFLHAFLGLFAVIIGVFALIDIRRNPALRGRIMSALGMAIGFFDFIYGTVQ